MFEVKNKLAGLIPLGGWRIEVLEWDDERRVLRSLEADGAVKCWRHPITVEALDVGGCIHRDALEIDASWLTGLHAGFAKRMYAKRHQTRQALRSKSTLQGSA